VKYVVIFFKEILSSTIDKFEMMWVNNNRGSCGDNRQYSS